MISLNGGGGGGGLTGLAQNVLDNEAAHRVTHKDDRRRRSRRRRGNPDSRVAQLAAELVGDLV